MKLFSNHHFFSSKDLQWSLILTCCTQSETVRATQQTHTLKKQWRTQPTLVGVSISLCVHLSVIHTPAVQSCTKQFPPQGSFREPGTIVCRHSNQRSRRLQSCSHFFFVTMDVQHLLEELFFFFFKKNWNHKEMGRHRRARRLSFTYPSICWKPLFCCEGPTRSATLSFPQLNVTYKDCLKHRMCLTVVTEHISATLKNPLFPVAWPCDALTWSRATATVTSLFCRAFFTFRAPSPKFVVKLTWLKVIVALSLQLKSLNCHLCVRRGAPSTLLLYSLIQTISVAFPVLSHFGLLTLGHKRVKVFDVLISAGYRNGILLITQSFVLFTFYIHTCKAFFVHIAFFFFSC